MGTQRIISITHGEDMDGIGSQAIINRYFLDLKNPIPDIFIKNKFKNNNESIGIDSIEIINITTDYSEYLINWILILSQNMHLMRFGFGQSDCEERACEPISNMNLFDVSINPDEITNISYLLNIIYSNHPPVHDQRFKKKLNDSILRYRSRLANPDLIIMSDLGQNKDFINLFHILLRFPFNLVYFDHHEHDISSQSFFRDYCSVAILQTDNKKCTAQIVCEQLLPEDVIAKRIAYYAWDSDLNNNHEIKTQMFQSILGHLMEDHDGLMEIEHLFRTGDFDSKRFDELYVSITQWETKQIDFMSRYPIKEILNINVSKKNIIAKAEFLMVASEMRPSRSLKLVNPLYVRLFGHEYDEKESSHFRLTIAINNINGKAVIHSNLFDVSNIARAFGGGGHFDRAGFEFPNLFLVDNKSQFEILNIKSAEFINKIIEIIQTNGI